MSEEQDHERLNRLSEDLANASHRRARLDRSQAHIADARARMSAEHPSEAVLSTSALPVEPSRPTPHAYIPNEDGVIHRHRHGDEHTPEPIDDPGVEETSIRKKIDAEHQAIADAADRLVRESETLAALQAKKMEEVVVETETTYLIMNEEGWNGIARGRSVNLTARDANAARRFGAILILPPSDLTIVPTLTPTIAPTLDRVTEN